MLRELVSKSPILTIPLSALFLFLTVFVGNLVRTYSRRASAYDPVAHLPLEEESTDE
jgi:hypothetical protein